MESGYKVCHMDLEGGFWGLISDKGRKLIPIAFPEQLKYVDQRVNCQLLLLEDAIGIHNWGMPCRILSFNTVQLEQ